MTRQFFLLAFIAFSVIFSTSLSGQSNSGMFFVFLNSNPDKPQISDTEKESLQAAHLANIDRLATEGKLLAAGPFESGGGMFVLKAKSHEEANMMLQTDPAIKAGRFNLEVLPFHIVGNNICDVKEPYEMVTYQFVRFSSDPDYFDDLDKVLFDTRIFMSDLNNNNDFVIAYGIFNEFWDGILIMDVADADQAETIFKDHPGVKEGQLKYEIKSLYIAKGTFCKK